MIGRIQNRLYLMVLSLWSSLHYLSFVPQDTMAYCRKTIEIFTEASTGWEIIIRDDEDVSPDLAILLPGQTLGWR